MGHLKSLSSILPKVSAKALRKKGYWVGILIQNWKMIVGEDMAEHTFPLKLQFSSKKPAVLYIQVNIPSLTLELQHKTPRIIEKITTILGEPVVGQVKFLQGSSK